jgi:uncharacterized membrane protein YkvA (DUF1232 family)
VEVDDVRPLYEGDAEETSLLVAVLKYLSAMPRLSLLLAAASLLIALAANAQTAVPWVPRMQTLSAQLSVTASLASEQDLGRRARRLQTRAERSLTRFGVSLANAGTLWLWVLLSAAIFLVTTALASVADLRLLDMRRQRLRAQLSYVTSGVRLFFRVLRDRRTPMLARLPVILGLCYWLIPQDLISDVPVLPGFIDDVVVAIASAKTFLYLCPDAVVARHAQSLAVKAEAN